MLKELFVLEELHEGRDDAEGVRAVCDQPLEEDSDDLFLDVLCLLSRTLTEAGCLVALAAVLSLDLLLALASTCVRVEEVDEPAAEPVAVRVGVSQVSRSGTEYEVGALGVELLYQAMEQVDRGIVGLESWLARLGFALGHGNAAAEHDDRVDERDVVSSVGDRLTTLGKEELVGETGGHSSLHRLLEFTLEVASQLGRLQSGRKVAEQGRSDGEQLWDVTRDGLDAQWVWQLGRQREGARDEVVELSAAGWDDVGERIVVDRQELGEVVEEDQDRADRAEIDGPDRLAHLALAEEGSEEAEEGDEESME